MKILSCHINLRLLTALAYFSGSAKLYSRIKKPNSESRYSLRLKLFNIFFANVMTALSLSCENTLYMCNKYICNITVFAVFFFSASTSTTLL